MRSSFAPPAAESPSPGAKCSCRPGLPPAFSSACASGGSAPPSKPRATALLTAFLPVAEACNEVLFDFKIMEPERARSLLRMNQPRVLDNFRQLAARKINLIPRVPLIQATP